LRNFGPVSAELLYFFGIRSADEVLNADPYKLFMNLQEFSTSPLSRNYLRAILGAQQDRHFADVTIDESRLS
ncbi:MAG: hypothetical protein KDB07_06440, partial [Planctomycetes bacterium]|nr:hypothetical protein [Planctomycetota bacterium]